jgi:hypothetical protein
MTRDAITEMNSADRAGWMRSIEAAVRRILGAGIAVVPKFTGGIAGGGASFPAAPATNTFFFRTDKKCWYMYDGSVWQIIGVESTTSTLASPSQAFTTGTLTDVTSSSTTVTTRGSGTIVGYAQLRVTSAAASQIQIRMLINGSLACNDQFESIAAGDTRDIGLVGQINVAAGSITCKLQAALTVGASVTITSYDIAWVAQKT